MSEIDTRDLVAVFEEFVAAKIREVDRAAGIEDAVEMIRMRVLLGETLTKLGVMAK